MSKSDISKIESPSGNPTEATLKKVANALGVRVAYLIGEEDTGCDLDEAISRQALRKFLKESPVERKLMRLLEDIAEEGAGPITPEGWEKLIKYVWSNGFPESGRVISLERQRRKRPS